MVRRTLLSRLGWLQRQELQRQALQQGLRCLFSVSFHPSPPLRLLCSSPLASSGSCLLPPSLPLPSPLVAA